MRPLRTGLFTLMLRMSPLVPLVTSRLEDRKFQSSNLDRIAAAPQRAFDRPHGMQRVHSDCVRDQRLRGGGARVPPLSTRLPRLQAPDTLA